MFLLPLSFPEYSPDPKHSIVIYGHNPSSQVLQPFVLFHALCLQDENLKGTLKELNSSFKKVNLCNLCELLTVMRSFVFYM